MQEYFDLQDRIEKNDSRISKVCELIKDQLPIDVEIEVLRIFADSQRIIKKLQKEK